MANTENIEAQLCAYIDGELDATGRAEIEKHLAANPQHRKLMLELARTRELMQSLPRENAPADISESLQGQLERSILLDDSDADPADLSMRINRWPQVLAVAAILMLAVGLAAVVYFVISPSHQQEFSLAKPEAGKFVATPSTTEPTAAETEDRRELAKSGEKIVAKDKASDRDREEVAMADSMKSEAKHGDGSASGGRAIESDTVGKISNQAKPAAKQLDNAFARAITPAANVDTRQVQQQLFDAGVVATRDLKSNAPGANEVGPLFVVVSTQDPAATYECVNSYLRSNNISWDQVTVPMPAPMNSSATQTAIASRLNRQQVQLKSGGPAMNQATTAPSAPTTQSAPDQVASAGAAPAKAAPSASAAPTTTAAPSDLAQSIELAESGKSSKADAKPSGEVQQQPQQQLEAQAANPFANDGNPIYVARNMTRRQAVDLQTSLSRAPIAQRADVIDERAATIVAAAADATHTPNQQAPTTEKYSLDGDPNRAFAFATTTAPSTQSSTQPVAQQIDIVRGVEDRTKESVAASPSTAPATQATSQPAPMTVADSTTKPSEGSSSPAMPMPTTMAASQPTGGSTGGASTDQPVDVVIVVQSAAPAPNSETETAAATPPSTAPTDTPTAREPAEAKEQPAKQ